MTKQACLNKDIKNTNYFLPPWSPVKKMGVKKWYYAGDEELKKDNEKIIADYILQKISFKETINMVQSNSIGIYTGRKNYYKTMMERLENLKETHEAKRK